MNILRREHSSPFLFSEGGHMRIVENILQVFDQDLSNTNYIQGGNFKKVPLKIFTEVMIPLVNTYQRSNLPNTKYANDVYIELIFNRFSKTYMLGIGLGEELDNEIIFTYYKKDKFPVEEKVFKQFSMFYGAIYGNKNK